MDQPLPSEMAHAQEVEKRKRRPKAQPIVLSDETADHVYDFYSGAKNQVGLKNTDIRGFNEMHTDIDQYRTRLERKKKESAVMYEMAQTQIEERAAKRERDKNERKREGAIVRDFNPWGKPFVGGGLEDGQQAATFTIWEGREVGDHQNASHKTFKGWETVKGAVVKDDIPNNPYNNQTRPGTLKREDTQGPNFGVTMEKWFGNDHPEQNPRGKNTMGADSKLYQGDSENRSTYIDTYLQNRSPVNYDESGKVHAHRNAVVTTNRHHEDCVGSNETYVDQMKLGKVPAVARPLVDGRYFDERLAEEQPQTIWGHDDDVRAAKTHYGLGAGDMRKNWSDYDPALRGDRPE